LIYLLTPQRLLLSTRIIIAWNVGAVCFLSLVLIMSIRATPAKMRSQAQRQDASRWIILIVTVIAACTSLLAIVFMLSGSKNLPQRVLILHIALALLTIFTSWFVQITSDLLRRLALIHQILSFFFNTLILALAINIMASLI
jgi:uncharacterized membrane protein